MSTVARPAARRPPFRAPDCSLRGAGGAGVLVLLDVPPRIGVLPRDHFPPMSEMLTTLFEQLGEVRFWEGVSNTVQGWALGLGIAAGLAIPIGIVIGSSRLLYRAMRGVIEFLRPIPSVALIPLAILIYGTGLESKVFLAAFASFWQLLVATLYGVQDVDPVATDTARSFGFSRAQRLFRVTLPSAIPYIATGLRIASAVSLILCVTAELVIGSPGLGRSLNLAGSGGNEELMYALILTTGILGLLLNTIFVRIERRVLHWHPSHRPGEAGGLSPGARARARA